MDLSIVIASWNTREMTRNCLASLLPNLISLRAEIIVIDNASSDGSQKMVATEFPNVRLLCNEKNLGFAAATNQGLEVATGEYLLLLNSDTLIHADVVSRSVEYLNAHLEVGMMGCKVLNGDGSIQFTCSQYPSFLNLLLQATGANRIRGIPLLQRYQMLDWDRDDEREVDVVSGCYLLVRRKTLTDIGLLDDSFFLYGEETDWCKRCADSGWQLKFAPVGTITHFGGGSCKSLNYRRDLFLSEGIIHLHLKHSGLIAGIAMWLLLYMFSCSRLVYWSARGFILRHERSMIRAEHFRQIVTHFGQSWPEKKEYSK